MEDSTNTTTEPKLSLTDVNDLTTHLSAVLLNPNTPTELYDSIQDGLSRLDDQAAAKTNRPEVVKQTLLAYATNGFRQKLKQTEDEVLEKRTAMLYEMIEDPKVSETLKAALKKYIYGSTNILVEETEVDAKTDEQDEEIKNLTSSSSLPKLISVVLNHPDCPELVNEKLWNAVHNEDNIKANTPETIAWHLGLKV